MIYILACCAGNVKNANVFIFQMAVWLPGPNRFYLPPQPIQRTLNTEEYVRRTSTFLHAATDRLLTVGHPFYNITNADGKEVVPKVSSNQFRAFRVRFPNPNTFAFCDKSLFNPDKERLVWGIRGIEVSRGQPLGIGVTGNPFFNKFDDAENPYNGINKNNITDQGSDSRLSIAFDPKQTQLLIVGAKPAKGEYWDVAATCENPPLTKADDKCPALELKSSYIEDADMSDIGLGNLNFSTLQRNKSDAPLDIVDSICKYPDYLQMIEELYGDHMFFYVRREALYARHIMQHAGKMDAEQFPTSLYIDSSVEGEKLNSLQRTDRYFMTPSGSLVATEQQLFNRPFWLQRSQGHNNGILWHNEAFVTLVDTTRGTNFTISVPEGDASSYNNSKFFEFLRHTEEFQLAFILQLCKVDLTPENLAYIHTMDPSIIEDWHLAVTSPPNSVLEDHYRYILSIATKCPSKDADDTSTDPYKDLKFWEVDLRDRMTEQLDQTPLGRKFLFQTGITQSSSNKRVSTQSTALTTYRRPTKRRRKA
uniref:Major capsid protein L1 n=2 Tax=Human papillomavirus type 41 TaxID=10589 RepID=VL1_HPV41|nr:RecName: Full=Major capsid protein L1 [Human papillomavirus type 41]